MLNQSVNFFPDYFSFEINENDELVGIPLLLEGYVPDFNKIPQLVLRLACQVNWEEEKPCFETFCLELAEFYSCDSRDSSYEKSQHETEAGDEEDKFKSVMEHVIFPKMQKVFKPPKICAENRTFHLAANLPDLYKVFERC